MGDFVDCVKSRGETINSTDSAPAVEAVCRASAIAVDMGRLLKWDPADECFVGDAEANRMLSRAMRSPWHL